MRNLRAGQNADLASERLQFATEPRCAVAVLIVDDGGQALSPDAFVTNNRSAPGVQVQGSAAHIDTAELPEAAARALCIALEPPPGTSLNCCIESDNGGDAASMAVEAASIFPATICFEIYRRAARWKIRAVGQGYQGGRTELLAAYGLAGLAEKSRVAVSEPPVHRDPAASAFPPLGTDNPVERLSMIFEDATRITAAFLSARDFAHSRRDDELSAAVADPRTRNTPAARKAADTAQQRHNDLISRAGADYHRDAAQLAAELEALDSELPASMASWESPSWMRPATPAPGILLGTVARPDVGALTVPLCTTAPLRRPTWVDVEQASVGAPLAASLILRLLVAETRPPSLDIVDLEGTLHQLCQPLAKWMPRPAVVTADDAAARLRDLAHFADLASMSQHAGLASTPGIVVVAGIPHALPPATLADIAVLINKSRAAGLSLILVGGPTSGAPTAPLLQDISDCCLHLPTDSEVSILDPWARTPWQFTPARLEAVARLADMIEAVKGAPN